MSRKFVLAGGSGFLGRALTAFFTDQGDEVVVLSRSGRGGNGGRSVQWDGQTVGEWASEIEGATAVVNLSGAPISKKHTDKYKKELIDSRVLPTRAIGEAIALAKDAPKVWVNVSAIGFYGDRGAELLGESSGPGEGSLAEIGVKWEAASQGFDTPQTRKVMPRLGIVLGKGGALAEFKKIPHRAIGNGKQYISWIHERDVVRMVDWVVSHDVSGPINAVAPGAVTNEEFFTTLNQELGRPALPPMPRPIFEFTAGLMGLEASVALVSQRVDPRLALVRGFSFDFPTLRPALQDLLDNVPAAWRQGARP